MNPKDLSVLGITQTLSPVVFSGNTPTDAGTTAIDGKNCAAVEHVLLVGESGDAWSDSVETDVILQHSTDNSTWAAVTTAAHVICEDGMEDITAGLVKDLDAEADDCKAYRVTYVGPYRYSRLYLNFTGNHSTGTPMAAFAILHKRMTGSLAPAS